MTSALRMTSLLSTSNNTPLKLYRVQVNFHYTLIGINTIFQRLTWASISTHRDDNILQHLTQNHCIIYNINGKCWPVLRVEKVKMVGQAVAEIWRFFNFSKMAAVLYLGFVLHVLDHSRRVLGGFHRCAKFGWNRRCSFADM